MKDKKILISIIFCVLIFIILLITLGIKHFYKSDKVDNYQYVISYNDGGIPGNRYDIKVNNDFVIKIIHQPGCSTVECMNGSNYPEEKNYELNFSDSNKKELKIFLEELFDGQTTNLLNLEKTNISEYQDIVINSIILQDEKLFQVNVEKYQYLLQYEKDNYNYYIYIKENNLINVNKLDMNIEYLKINSIDSYNIEFSKDNVEKINELVKKIFADKTSKIYYVNNGSFSKEEMTIIESIISNDESIMNQNKEILFELTSTDRVNCLTGKIIVYTDNSYEYVYGVDNKGNNVSKFGEFSYNVGLIKDNLNNYESNNREPFTMKYNNGDIYYIYDNNIELIEFITEIGVKIDTCITYID